MYGAVGSPYFTVGLANISSSVSVKDGGFNRFVDHGIALATKQLQVIITHALSGSSETTKE